MAWRGVAWRGVAWRGVALRCVAFRCVQPPEWELLTRVRRDKFYPNTSIAYWERERQLIVSCTDKTLSFFSLTPKRVWCSSVFSVFETPMCLTVTPSGYAKRDIVVFGDSSGNVQLYDAAKQEFVQRVGVHAAQVVRKVAFLPRLGLVSAGMDGRIAILDEEKSTVRYLGAGRFSESMLLLLIAVHLS